MAWCQKLKSLFTHFRKLLRAAFAREYKIHLKLITCNLSAWTDLGFFRNRPRLKLFWIFWLISAISFPSDHIFCLFLVLISILKSNQEDVFLQGERRGKLRAREELNCYVLKTINHETYLQIMKKNDCVEWSVAPVQAKALVNLKVFLSPRGNNQLFLLSGS